MKNHNMLNIFQSLRRGHGAGRGGNGFNIPITGNLFFFFILLVGGLMLVILSACSTTPTDPVQRAYIENQNARQFRAQQQAQQRGLDNYRRQNQAAARRRF
jgi:hypothetical protein